VNAPPDLPNATRRRLRAIHDRLAKRFGPLDPPRAADPLDELVLTVLSQHTSDLNAERAFGDLRAGFPTWDDVVDAPTTAVADAIRSGGLANTKAPRIGPKTAAVVLSFALGRDALPVDTHVHRTTRRLGIVPPTASAERADRLLHDLVPEGLRTPMHVGLIRLGREICKAPVPRCRACPLRDLCPTAPRYLTSARKRSNPA